MKAFEWSGSRAGDLAALAVATLVSWRTRICSPRTARPWLDAAAGAGRLDVPQAGHAVVVEAVEVVTEGLLAHLPVR